MSRDGFLRNADGVASIEFAFIAAPFFALMGAILEVGYLRYENEMLAVAVAEAKRALTTGGVQKNGAVTSGASFVSNYICPASRTTGAFKNFDCSKMVVDVRPVGSFQSADLGNGFLSGAPQFCPGHGSTISLMRVAYPLSAIFPLNLFDPAVHTVTVGGVTGNYHILLASAVFQTEDFTGGVTLPGCLDMATKHGPAFPLRRLARDERGNAAIEFAFVMPLMILIYVGVVVLADGVMTSRNLSNLTRTLVDMTSKQATSGQATSTPAPSTAVASTTLDGILNASQTLIFPQPVGPLQMTISAVDVTNTTAGICCKVLVRWTYTKGGSLRPCGSQLTAASGSSLALTEFPATLLPYGATLSQPMTYVVADTSFTYQPLTATNIAPSFLVPMSRYEISMPRSSGQVVTQALPASGASHGQVCY